jgi:hypothetical protein
MKMKSIAAFAALSILLSIAPIASSNAAPSCAEGGECVVGDTGPGGGKVFFVKATGSFTKSRTEGAGMYSQTYTLSLTADQQSALPFDYLEVAPTQSGSFRWGSNGGITGGTSTLIGTGASNTANIIASFPGDTAANNAAIFADTYTNNGKNDWFLPSYDELLLINILSLESDSGGPNIGSFPDGHWASTSTDNSNARYSARTQLSGYVVKASSAKSRAIRSFSKVASNSSNTEDDSARRENERKRREAILNAQQEIVRKVRAHIEVLKTDLLAAESALIGEPLLEKANVELFTLDTATAIDFPRINFVIQKFGIYDQIAGNLTGTVYPRNLVIYGLLPIDTPMKSLITRNLMALSVDERNTVEKINAFIVKARADQVSRKERLAATIARIYSR